MDERRWGFRLATHDFALGAVHWSVHRQDVQVALSERRSVTAI
jgi:hypothetical protein